MPHSPSPPSTPPATVPLRRAPRRGQAGFSLIEVLVTALIVALLSAATAKALIATSHTSADERVRSQANSMVSQDQDRLRGLSDAALNGLNQTRTVTLNGTPFTVVSTSNYLDTTGASTCTSTSVAYYKTTSTVSWSEGYSNRSDTSASSESVLSRPVSGDMRVQVSDQTLAPLSGVAIRATGPDIQSSTTDSNGCVLFAGLSTGAYTTTLAKSGYVDPDGDPTPSNATATVTATGTASPNGSPFHLGLAGSVNGTFTTSTSGAFGQADAISSLGNGASLSMSGGYNTTCAATASCAAPATSLTTGPLFPFDVSSGAPSYTNNYTVWAGRCLQQEPPATNDVFTVAPGSTGTAHNVQEPLLDVGAVTYYNGSTATVKPAHVKLTFTSTQPTTATCSYSWTPTLSSGAVMPVTGWLAYPGQPFASTATTGSSASASSNSSSPQAGNITVCADYNVGATYYKATVTTTNSSLTSMNVVPTIAIRQFTNSGAC